MIFYLRYSANIPNLKFIKFSYKLLNSSRIYVIIFKYLFFRGVAQLVERVVWDHEVARSIRVTPTKKETFTVSFFYVLGYLKPFFIFQTFSKFLYICVIAFKTIFSFICLNVIIAFNSISILFVYFLTANSYYVIIYFGDIK